MLQSKYIVYQVLLFKKSLLNIRNNGLGEKMNDYRSS